MVSLSSRMRLWLSRFIVRCLPIALAPSFIYLIAWVVFHISVTEHQGEVFRLIYLHLPTSLASSILFVCVVILSVIHWVWHMPTADWIASISAKWGAFSAFTAWVTGVIWGHYALGSWWVWDVRLTTEIVLFFMYMAYIVADEATQNYLLSKQVLAVISVVGGLNVLLVRFAIQWWYTLHQELAPAYSHQTVTWDILLPLFFAVVLWMLLSIWVIFRHVQIRRREADNLLV